MFDNVSNEAHASELLIPWESLDDSIWERIFRYVPLRTRIQHEVVCRRWCKAIRSKRLWTSLNVATDNELNTKVTLVDDKDALGAPRRPLVDGLNFWARFSPIKEIDLTGTTVTFGSPIRYLSILGHCKKLEILKMSDLRAIPNQHPVFILSNDLRKVNEFMIRAEKLQCLEIDVRVQSRWFSTSRQRWLDPWQWHTIIQWLQSPIVRMRRLEILHLPVSIFAKLPNNRGTYFEDHVHPFVNLQVSNLCFSPATLRHLLQSLGEALVESQLHSLSMGRGCMLGDEGTLLLMECIQNNKSIRRLQIRHNRVTSNGVKHLATMIQKYALLFIIDNDRCNAMFICTRGGCPPLAELDVRYNIVRKEAGAMLEKALKWHHPRAQLLY